MVVNAQGTIPASGGNASGSGGSVSYTVGQIGYSTSSGASGSSAAGVQQPFEISVATAVENVTDIILECSVYPNPTSGKIKLIINSFDKENLRFRLYDINGAILEEKKVESRETEISMESFSSAIYLLKVINNNKEVKVFKIVKN
jgi:hypothetical protein